MKRKNVIEKNRKLGVELWVGRKEELAKEL